MVVFDGFSKAYGMTGWRLGFAHGPRRIIEEMIKLQQFSFVCAPSMVQEAGIAAWDADVSGHVQAYQKKRDRLYQGLKDRFEVSMPGGAFCHARRSTPINADCCSRSRNTRRIFPFAQLKRASYLN